jgi:hypothetical protein
MPKNITNVTEQDLINIPLPQDSSDNRGYTTVSNSFIINNVRQELLNNGFTIVNEEYKSALKGQISQGIYYLNYGNDPDLSLMFTWLNSYNKMLSFRCSIGGYVYSSNSSIITGDMATYGRKHNGNADEQVQSHIVQQMSQASNYYTKLVADKNVMKNITLTKDQIAMLVGKVFIADNILGNSRLQCIKDELENPSYQYSTPEDNLWTIYNHFIYVLRKSHPLTWMESQKRMHQLIKNTFFPKSASIDPNQLDLAEEAEKIEALGEAMVIPLTSTDDLPLTTLDTESIPTQEIETSWELSSEDSTEEELTEFSLDDYEIAKEVLEEQEEDIPQIPEPEMEETVIEEEIIEEPKTDETGLLLVDDFNSCPEQEELSIEEVELGETIGDGIVIALDPSDTDDEEVTFDDQTDLEDEEDDAHGDVIEYSSEDEIIGSDFDLDINEESVFSASPAHDQQESSEESDVESPDFEF